MVFRPYTQVGRSICTSESLRTPPEFPLASSCPGIVHHLSGANVCALAPPRRRVSAWDGPLLPFVGPVRRVGWVTDLLAANHDSASAGELPARSGFSPANPPPRDQPGQQETTSLPSGFSAPFPEGVIVRASDNREKPMGLDGVTNLRTRRGITPASRPRRDGQDTSTAGLKVVLFPLTRVRRGVLPAVGSAHPGDRVCVPAAGTAPEGGVYPTPPAPRSSGD
ncbi:hypothetical protein HPB49_015178 [Dermacentor silvarum]|uniref:Uncharacterized protein n=1 Tax=Dermacentor silvarum TaxID=543639 RepID=A0ACB8CY28_DERSI|nr:hypothetical protein HPB49_015178 [Dermacentor silvarum]